MKYAKFVDRPSIQSAELALLEAIVELKELHWSGFSDATGWNRTYCFLASKNLQTKGCIVGSGKYVATELGKILIAIMRGKRVKAQFHSMRNAA